MPFVFVALAHFAIGYAWGRAIMAAPLTMPLALAGIAAAGVFFRLALAMGTNEVAFAWAGPLAAVALADTTSRRNLAYSAAAFVVGYVALIWLAPA